MPSKFLTPILICCDINLETLVDITIYDDSHILLTCKSFIKRYHIDDRKQINSWITKAWHQFSSAAVKNPLNDSIYAVINNKYLIHWNIDEEDIDSVKKLSFSSSLHSVVTYSNKVYIVYSSGYIGEVDKEIASRKTKKEIVINEKETIVNVLFVKTDVVGILSNEEDGDQYFYRIKPNSSVALDRVHLSKNQSLTGCLLLSFGDLLTSWSCGKIHSVDIQNEVGSNFPGRLKSHIKLVEPTKKLKLIELSPNHVVLSGLGSDSEGGILILWDYKFGVCISTRRLKMYADPPLGWRVPGGVVVPDGKALLYVPVQIDSSTIASMLGSRSTSDAAPKLLEDSISWFSKLSENIVPVGAIQNVLSNKSIKLTQVIERLNLTNSVSENKLIEDLVTYLIEKKDLNLIKECLVAFKAIPEKNLVAILKFFINFPEEELSNCETVPIKLDNSTGVNGRRNKKRKSARINGIIKNIKEEENGDLAENDAERISCPFSNAKASLVNQVLGLPFSEPEMSRSVSSLDFRECLDLLKHLHFLLSAAEPIKSKCTKGVPDSAISSPSVENLSAWLSFLIDAHYFQFVMTSELRVQKDLLACFHDVVALQKFLDVSQSIEILIERILATKTMPKSMNSSPYSLERIIL